MPEFLRKILPGSPAERLLERNAALSRELSASMTGMVEDATTVFDRREQTVTPLVDRRKAAAR